MNAATRGLSDCAMVVESVREDRALKMAILARIERAAPRALLATNTSGLPVGGLAKALADPSRFLGLHFFSPAERMPLVEVVRGPETSTATVETALRVVRSIGKSPVMVRDGPGFFATRSTSTVVLRPTLIVSLIIPAVGFPATLTTSKLCR